MIQMPSEPIPESVGVSKRFKAFMFMVVAMLLLGVVLPAAYFLTGSWRRQRAYDNAAGNVLDCPADVDEQICDAAEFVQVLRGRSFRTFPEVRVIGSDEFDESLADDWVDEAWLGYNDTVYTALGLIGDDVDLVEVERTQGIASILGYYSLGDQTITIRGPELNPFTLETLVHELSHAYDDQWLTSSTVPFTPPTWAFETDSQGFVRLVVEEGMAELVAKKWLDAQPDDVKEEYDRIIEQRYGSEPSTGVAVAPFAASDSDSLDVWFLLQGYPYVSGPGIVEQAAEGNEEIDQLITDPPDTIERLLHPDVDDQDDPVVEVEAPTEVEAEYEGQLGELQLSFVLGVDAAAGWDGDRFVAWNESDRSCITVHVAAESSTELAQMVDGAQGWQERDPGRTVETVQRDGLEVLRLATCD